MYAKNNNEIIKTINLIAPEHLEINLKKYNQILKGVSNAGSIFIGKYSAEAFGDYLAVLTMYYLLLGQQNFHQDYLFTIF